MLRPVGREGLALLAEGEVPGDGDQGPFLPCGDDLEEELCAPAVQVEIAELGRASYLSSPLRR
jgi:hypothetical protein